MPILHRTRRNAPIIPPAHTATADPVASGAVPGEARPESAPRAVSATRTSTVWASVWAVAIILIVVIVFILQNTRSVQVSFLGMHGALPLAVGLLIAMVTGAVITLVLGTARITQLRRLARRRR
jgi:putative membrane protein